MICTESGYALVDDVFSQAEIQHVRETLSCTPLERTKAGARHVLSVRVVRSVAVDSRLLDIAREFVGRGAEPFRATLFDKSPAANWLVVWHQDRALPLCRRCDDPAWGPWSRKAGILYGHAPAWALEQVVALRVNLDNSSRTNGPLRVIPNTHTRGVLTDAAIEQITRSETPVDCVTRAGGVVAMRPLMVHASSKSLDDRPRRVLHIEYASARNLGSGIELAVA